MPLVAFSKGNLAGEVIASKIITGFGFEEQQPIASEDNKYSWRNWRGADGLRLVEITTMHIFSDYLKDYELFNEADLLVFASTHRSGAGVPSLTVHSCGNLTQDNQMGGNPSELAFASAKAVKCGYTFLAREENHVDGFTPAIEATHHGPTSLKAPVLFAEVGSTEKEWGNETACGKVADCIMHVCENWRGEQVERFVLGFGGPHYLGKFADLLLEKNWGFSHVASRHTAVKMKEGMVLQAAGKSLEKAGAAVVEKKSFNADERKKVIAEIEKAGLETLMV